MDVRRTKAVLPYTRGASVAPRAFKKKIDSTPSRNFFPFITKNQAMKTKKKYTQKTKRNAVT